MSILEQQPIHSNPTPRILHAADLIDKSIGTFLKICDTSLPIQGTYESHDEAYTLFGLVIRHIEAIIDLSRTDLVLLPAALTLSRTVFEISIRILWMLHPEDPFEREARWLAHLASEEDYWKRTANLLADMMDDNSFEITRRDTLREFRLKVTKRFPSGYKIPSKVPNLRELLCSLGEDARYKSYIQLSQYTHGTHFASSMYRRNLGTLKKFAEDIGPSDWFFPFNMCLWSLNKCGAQLLKRLGSHTSDFQSHSNLIQANDAVKALKKNRFINNGCTPSPH